MTDGGWCGRNIFCFCSLSTPSVSTRSELPLIMTSTSTSTIAESTMPAVAVLCKSCRAVHPIESFLSPASDAGCYRIRQQCRSCLTKSAEHYHAHREDLRATRQIRDRQSERVRCACGVSILASYREKHNQTHRHQTFMALLGNGDIYNILARSSTLTAAPTTAQAPARITIDAAEAAATSEEQWFAMLDKTRLSPRDPDVTADPEMLGALPTNKRADAGCDDPIAINSDEQDTSGRQAALTASTERYHRASLPRPASRECAVIEGVDGIRLLREPTESEV